MCSGDERPLEDLEREICELSAHIAAAMCRLLMLLAEWDERGGWCEWGCRSCAQWLSWRCSITLGAARERMRVARRLGELPRVRSAFAAGELSYSKVRAVTRVATPQTEEQLVVLARHATGAQLEKLVRGYRRALSATLDGAEAAFNARYLSWEWEDDGSLSMKARLAPDEGALMLQALRAQPTVPSLDGEERVPIAQREADALVSMARGALEADSGAVAGGDRCEVVVHVDAETLVGDEVVSRCELADGPAVAPETVRRLGCDGSLVRIVERDGQPLSVGRRTRAVPAAMRRALRSRDRGCRFPGCTHERFLHAHHVRHWARGGETSLDNLVQLCSFHHRMVHEGGFRVEQVARGGGVRFRRPDGRVVPPVGDPVRARGPDLVDRQRADGLIVDEDTCRALSAGDPLDYSIAVEGLLARELAGT